MKITKTFLKRIILEETFLFLEKKNKRRRKIKINLKGLELNETFKQDFIAGIVSIMADKNRNLHSQWAFEVFKPMLREKFNLTPKKAAFLLQYMKDNNEVSRNFYDNLKSILLQLLPRSTSLLQDEPRYKPQLKNVRNPVPTGYTTTEK